MNYEEKQMAKLERFQELASKCRKESVATFERSHSMLSGIPVGQPILVGHHSENAHRNLLKRSWNAWGKSIELGEKAEHYENKVQNILNPTAISSDDENAVTKLEDKLKKLQDKRESIKALNKERKKKGEDIAPSWVLSNLGQNINSVKKRIEYLKEKADIEEVEETYGDITLKVDKEDNRVRLFFPGKPSEEVRNKLKSNGFRWSPYNSAWQRMLNSWSLRIAREIAQEVQ